MAGNHKARYFFAVWPDSDVRERLGAWSAELRVDPAARRTASANLHITLVFLGEIEAPQLRAAREVADGVSWPGASLTLDKIGYWKRSRIVWAGPREGSPSLGALAEELRNGLRRRGFRVDDRAFVPRVTLLRKVRRRPRWRGRSIPWRIDEFCLMVSRLTPEGARYEVVDRWSAHGDME